MISRLLAWAKAAPIHLLDPLLFDPTYYRNANRGLSGLTDRQCRHHWRTVGIEAGLAASPCFSAREYLERYPDLAQTFGSEGYRQAAAHFLRYGRREGRCGRCGDEVLRTSGDRVSLAASRNWGYCIWSLRWKGSEFVNSHDAGRGLTAAWQEDELLEGRNPTEAGNIWDSGRPRCDSPSSSRPLGAQVEGKTLRTATQPAFWLPPGHPGSKADALLSESILSKRVSLDWQGNPHLIRWEVEIAFRGQRSLGRNQIQMLTLFACPHLRNFWAWNRDARADQRLRPLPIAAGQIWDPCGKIVRSSQGDLSDARIDSSRADEVRGMLTPRRGGVIVSSDDGAQAIGLLGRSAHRHDGWNMSDPGDIAWAARNLIDRGPGKGLPDDDATAFLSSVCRLHVGEGDRLRFGAFLAVGSLREVVETARSLWPTG